MIEAIAFTGGMIAMTIVWFITDIRASAPYRRGYKQGYLAALQEILKYILEI